MPFPILDPCFSSLARENGSQTPFQKVQGNHDDAVTRNLSGISKLLLRTLGMCRFDKNKKLHQRSAS